MKKQKQHFLDDDVTEHFEPIPVDIVINILSRLTTKYMVKCRCVSKQWSSIIRRPNYNQLFLIKSPAAPPRLLLAFEARSKLSFYTSTQPQNPDKGLSLVATHHHHTNLLDTDFNKFCRPVGGLVCSKHSTDENSWAVISNPITGESVTTSKVGTTEGDFQTGLMCVRAEYSFGYDPIDKLYKVLRFTWLSENSDHWYAKYHVMTVGTGSKNHLLWRRIQCCTLHYPMSDNGICIDGVLFYPATTNDDKTRMVCFNVRSEEFSFIDFDTKIGASLTLINYMGKLGACRCDYDLYGRFELWVLEDAQKHKWSKRVYQMPLGLIEKIDVQRPAGMIGSSEIVLYTSYTKDPFFLIYYNLERNIITRVSFEGLSFKYARVYAFPNYILDEKLI